MPCLAYTTFLKKDPDLQRQYQEYHDNAWPDVVDCIKKIGVESLHIWQNGRQLFMVAEVSENFDLKAGLGAYLDLSPRCREWESIMDGFQEAPQNAKPGEKWALLDHVYSFPR
ncbi:MAG: L-rhamnose mutarotase [Opitutae bacterium]|nr:L-rhamnose mutarotase [Opitutae bacterium]MBT5689477.1 L-rhamnose mutarotase [Opitutae bacterium]MBT6461990.1 L-rhamnose mutarotase [Opitutae bacterium]MBT6959406.1 L-rhamnose mutarotase [Opitutae bacterium]MBT7854611.1 L-rhamnose mutarotase [Opitutae bacterium]